MGEELYIATSADDVNSIYKDTKNLDFDAVIVDLLREFGISKDTLDKLFDAQLSGGRNWMDRQHDVYRTQMHPGGRGDALADAVLGRIDKAVQWDRVIAPIALQHPGSGPKRVSLWKWCAHVLVEASMHAFFGPSFLRLSPEFVADYLRFDEDYWRLKAKSPEAAAVTKQNCVSSLLRWLDRSEAERTDACWMVAKIEQDFANIGISDRAQLAALLFINIEVYVPAEFCTHKASIPYSILTGYLFRIVWHLRLIADTESTAMCTKAAFGSWPISSTTQASSRRSEPRSTRRSSAEAKPRPART